MVAGTNELAVAWEEHAWVPRRAIEPASRRDVLRASGPYSAAVPAQIATMAFPLEPSVAAAAEDARAEITRFDAQLSAAFPGGFAPLASVLLRTESASSSQIENITVGSRALALAELGRAKSGSNAALVAGNVEAMQRALALADDGEGITPEALLVIHEALMRGQAHAEPGRYRTEQVWISGRSISPHGAAFVPPHHSRVLAAIEDLCQFIRRTDMPLLAHASIAHAQFETIHPFNDGNGRTGRALVHAMLKHGGATTRTTVPVSAGLLRDTESYFAALTAYRNGDPSPIVERFNEATFAAIGNGRTLAADLEGIQEGWKSRLTARGDSVAWRILPILIAQPVVSSGFIQEQTGASQPAVDRGLARMVEDGILVGGGTREGRGSTWRADDVIAALDAFGERARRQRF